MMDGSHGLPLKDAALKPLFVAQHNDPSTKVHVSSKKRSRGAGGKS